MIFFFGDLVVVGYPTSKLKHPINLSLGIVKAVLQVLQDKYKDFS
jgi:hypothetical protein